MFFKKFGIPLIISLLVLSGILVAGCPAEVEHKPEISIGYVTWDCAIASTHVMKEVFEQAGYNVEIVATDAGPLYAALARGDVDFTTNAWLPHTHEDYWNEYGDRIDYVVANIPDEGIHGLVVPAYVTIDSIEEMNEVRDKFDGVITGIEPGAGVMRLTEDAIEAYDLDYELLASSAGGMAAALRSSIENEKWVVVTGWDPHWKWGRFDLKMLEDPLRIYGEPDSVVTLARQNLQTDDPEAYGILERFVWTTDDINIVMADIEAGVPEEIAARNWVENNPDKVSAWIG